MRLAMLFMGLTISAIALMCTLSSLKVALFLSGCVQTFLSTRRRYHPTLATACPCSHSDCCLQIRSPSPALPANEKNQVLRRKGSQSLVAGAHSPRSSDRQIRSHPANCFFRPLPIPFAFFP